MSYIIIEEEQLATSSRWNVESFLFAKKISSFHSDFEVISLSKLVCERKESVNPSDSPDKEIYYIGLENISQNDGVLVGDIRKKGFEIKSRSRVFYPGDILYGKLRPNLNKCLFVDDNIEGVCSGEIIVLIPNLELINPIFLKELLLSKYVSQHVMSMTSGATLPRLNVSEFLNIKVPLPNLDIQNKMANYMSSKRNKIIEFEREIKCLRETIVNEFQEFIESNTIKGQ
ncbi:restriction endonuclease subunit S [Escherichia coli]|nr:restriction endonuclease subunit S [Escherichia coli]